MQLTDFAKSYLLLGLRIGKLIDKYVDSYSGPPGLRQMVEKEINSPEALLQQCKNLEHNIKDQGFEKTRERHLERMLLSMETSLRILKGEPIPYLDQVRALLDIEPVFIDNNTLFKLIDELNDLYQGKGIIYDRASEVWEKRAIPKDQILETFTLAMQIMRGKTYEKLPNLLPEAENTLISGTVDSNFILYCWYLGNSKSKIEVNMRLDNIITWHNLLLNASHEGYPGHHVQLTVRDKVLYQEQGQFEHSILLMNTPQLVIIEGIADVSFNALYSIKEQEELALKSFCPNPSEHDIEFLIKEREIWRKLAYSTNLAIHAHVDGWDDRQLLQFLFELGLYPEDFCRQYVRYIQNPITSVYPFISYGGRRLIQNKFGMHPSVEDFRRLLTQPILPSDLV